MSDSFYVLSPNPISADDYNTLTAQWGVQWTGKEFPANVVTKTTWKCPKGHTWEARFNDIQQGSGCPHCAEVAPKNNDDYHVLAAEREFEWLGKELPANIATKTTWKCLEGHTWEACYNNIQQGTGCPICAEVAPKNIDDYRALATEHNVVWLGEEFPANTHTPTTWRCYKGHTWEACYSNIQQGRSCPVCAENAPKNTDDYHSLAAKRGYDWLGQELPANTATKTTWRCSKKHTWEARFNDINKGSGCPICAQQRRKGRFSTRKTEDDYYALAAERGFEWLGGKLPVTTAIKTTWKCQREHIWETPYASIRGGTGCPHCAEVASKTIDDYHALAKEKGFEWLGQELPANTATKTTWKCPKGHTWEARFNNIHNGSRCPHCAGNVPKTIDDYSTLATERGFEWLGQELPANVTTKTTWKCSEGHTWKARFNDIQQGSGCPHCAGLAPKTIDDYHALASEHNFVWFGEKFPANVTTPTTWMCYKGHTWEARFNDIQQDYGCPHCAERAPKTTDDYNTLARVHKVEWLGKELPANVDTPTIWKCPKGHTWKARFSEIQRCSGCPKCTNQKRKGQLFPRKTEDDYHILASEHKFEWLGQQLPANVLTKTTWKCPKGHTWEARFNDIQQRSGCPHCAERIPKTTDNYNTLATERGVEWLG